MDEGELIVKIDNLEKRVEALEKQISTIAQINQSERVKEYIASAEKASKIAKLLDAATDKKINDSPIGNATISDVLSNSSIMEKIDTAKEFVADIDSDVEKQIRENNYEANKYDWNTLFDYEEVNGQITIKSYIGFDDLNVVVIPDRINDLLVTKIDEKAFENCETVKKVILPQYLDSIGKRAFCRCGIKTIKLPDNLRIIGESAFSSSKLESIHITSAIKELSKSAFSWCEELKELTISNGINSIANGVFENCNNIKKIDIPNSVKNIGKNAFGNIGCYGCKTHIRIPDSCEMIYGINPDSWENILGIYSHDVIIYCNTGSTAMKYARKFSIPVKRYEEFDLL